MDSLEYKLFTEGAMDLDTAPELLPNGKYRRALNFRPYNTETGSVGTGTYIEGNRVIEYDLDLGFNAFVRTIGSKKDLKRKRLYYFIYASDALIGELAIILYYDYLTEGVVKIFEYENILGFGRDNIIQQVDIVYDDVLGDTLYWTNAATEPMKLNVTAAFNRFNKYGPKENYNEGDIDFANYDGNPYVDALTEIPCVCILGTTAQPFYDYTTGQLVNPTTWKPLSVGECYPPTLVKSMFTQKIAAPIFSPINRFTYDDTGVGVNTNIRRRSYQTRYKFVYFDGEESEWSPISDAVFSQELPAGIFSPTGGGLAELDFPVPKSLLIRIPLNIIRGEGELLERFTYNPHAMVARVRVCVREVPADERPQDWYEFINIPFEEFWQYNLQANSVSDGFDPTESGTYYFDYSNTFLLPDDTGGSKRIVTMDVEYDGNQTLIPTDVKDQSTNFYLVPKVSNTQCYADNRIFHGATVDQLDVPVETLTSLSEVVASAESTVVDIRTENVQTVINAWSPSTSTSVIGSTNFFVSTISINGAFDLSDYSGPFFYDFTLGFTIIRTSRIGFFSRRFTGSCLGIPSQFSTWQAFMASVLEGVYPWPGVVTGGGNNATITILFASANETTGQISFGVVVNGTVDDIVTSANTAIMANTPNRFFRIETYLPTRTFKNHSEQVLGIAIQDDLGRLTPVLSPANLKVTIPHFISPTLQEQSTAISLTGLENVVLPDYARAVHIVRRRSSSFSDYIQFAISRGNCPAQSWNRDKQFEVGILNLDLDEFTSNSVNNAIAQTKYLYVSLNSVNGGDGGAYDTLFNTSVGRFTPQVGDTFRFLYRMSMGGQIFQPMNDAYTIAVYSEKWNTIGIPFEQIAKANPALAEFLEESSATENRLLCEVVKRPTQSENEFYWETATQLFVDNGKILTDSPVTIKGDSYLKLRGYCIIYDQQNVINSVYQNFSVLDRNYSDFFESANSGNGRANTILRGLQSRGNIYSEIKSDNLIRYSEQSIQNTDRRNFAKIYDTNLQEVDNVFGKIELLHSEGDLIRIYQEDKRAKIYVGRGVTTELSGAQRLIATQNNVHSDVVYEEGEYGISEESESFAAAGYRKYYTDSKRAMVYRQSLDGITPISEVGMSGEFKRIFGRIRQSYIKPLIRGVVDERLDEYILSFLYGVEITLPVFDVSPFLFSFTTADIGFAFWSSGDKVLIDPYAGGLFTPQEFDVYSQTPDGTVTVLRKPGPPPTEDGDLIRVVIPVVETLIYSERTGGWTTFSSLSAEWLESGIQAYHSFENGKLAIHEFGCPFNTFFGKVQPTTVEVVSNRSPLGTKEWRTIGVKSNNPVFVGEGDVLTSLEQTSQIPLSSFKKLEGTYASPFYRDNFTRGNRLKGRWLQTKITIPVSEQQLKFAGVLFNSIDSPNQF